MHSPSEPIPPAALLRHGNFVRSIARQLLADEGLAEDVAQETYLLALQSPPRSAAALTTWLGQVARRLSLRHLRSGARRRRREEGSARAESLPSVADELGRESVLREVGEAVLALREPYRSAVFGRYYEEKSVAQLAREAGCPVSTIESRLRRAMGQLRGRFDDDHGGKAWCLSLLPLVSPDALTAAHAASTAAQVAPSIATSGAATGTLIMSTQLKWSLAAAAAALTLVAGWNLRPDDRIERSTGSTETVSRQAPLAAVDAPDAPNVEADTSRVTHGVAAAPAEPQVVAPPDTDTGSLRMSVRYADGEPATGRALDLMPWDGGNPFADKRVFRTNANGEVLADDVPAGRVFVGLDIANGWVVDVIAGEETTADFEIPLGITVHGRVLDPTGKGVEGADVWISEYGVDTEGYVVTRSTADGAYSLPHIPSGRRIAAMVAGFDPAHLRQVTGNAGAEVTIDLRLHAGGAAIVGSATDATGEPQVGAVVRYLPDDPGATTGTDGEPDLGLAGHATMTDEAGAFQLVGLPVGPGRFYVRRPGLAPYSESVELGAGDELVRHLTLQPEGVIRGTVTDAEGVAVAGARLMCGDYGAPDFSLVHSDSEGAYALTDLRLGRIEVRVEHDEMGTAKAEFTLAAGVPTEWNPALSLGLVLRGRVQDTRGEPLAGWYVDVSGVRPPEGELVFWSEQRKTDADGRFEVPGCPEYALAATLRTPDYSTNPVARQRGFFAIEGELQFVIDGADLPSARVKGAVGDAQGQPAMGAVRVTLTGGEQRFSLKGELVQGAFDLGPLFPGTYALSVDPDGAPTISLTRFEVVADEELELPLLVLPRTSTLILSCSERDAFAKLTLTPQQEQGSGRRSPAVYGDPIGQEIVLWPGHYALKVRGPGSVPFLREIELDPGERLELSLEARAGRMCVFHCLLPTGTTDAIFLMVDVIRDDRNVSSWVEREPARSDYSVRGMLEPGEYRVFARTHAGYEWDGPVTVVAGAGEQRVELALQKR